jgi:hypothetical protein
MIFAMNVQAMRLASHTLRMLRWISVRNQVYFSWNELIELPHSGHHPR